MINAHYVAHLFSFDLVVTRDRDGLLGLSVSGGYYGPGPVATPSREHFAAAGFGNLGLGLSLPRSPSAQSMSLALGNTSASPKSPRGSGSSPRFNRNGNGRKANALSQSLGNLAAIAQQQQHQPTVAGSPGHGVPMELGMSMEISVPAVITSVERSGPARDAGLRVGDRILAINEQLIDGLTHDQVAPLHPI